MTILLILTHAFAIAVGYAASRWLGRGPDKRCIRRSLYIHARNRVLHRRIEMLETECTDLAELHERLLERVKAHTAIEVQRQEFAQPT